MDRIATAIPCVALHAVTLGKKYEKKVASEKEVDTSDVLRMSNAHKCCIDIHCCLVMLDRTENLLFSCCESRPKQLFTQVHNVLSIGLILPTPLYFKLYKSLLILKMNNIEKCINNHVSENGLLSLTR